jgi:hypothetical protein
MKNLSVPFNVFFLELKPATLMRMRPTTSLEIFDNANNLHPDGLFSTLTFGKVGDPLRMQKFSYIDIKVDILHPVMYRAIGKLKRFHTDILAGREYAVWNEELKDFDRSNIIEGQTGYEFFMRHMKSIVYPPNKSVQRQQNIELFNKFKDKALVNKIVVMPAGFRDVEIDNGRVTLDEINGFYKTILSIANTISPTALQTNIEMLNRSRFRLQTAFNELFAHLERMIQGKRGFLLGSWASRSPMNGTRNVITALVTRTNELGAPGSITMNDTVLGIYQAMKAYMPVARFLVRNKYLPLIFSSVERPARLVDPKTLKMVDVQLKPQVFDRWNTDEGVEKIISAFGEESVRHKPLMIDGHYMGLVYRGPDATFKFLQDIDDLPPHLDKKNVTPMTFVELMYMSIGNKLNEYPMFVTRYPVTGVGSIYPSFAYVKTTIAQDQRRELNDLWQPWGETFYSFPVPGGEFVNSLIPHPMHISPLGADFDGDMCSANGTYTDESKVEIKNFLSKKKAYVGTDGRFIYPAGTDTISLLLHNLTGEPA